VRARARAPRLHCAPFPRLAQLAWSLCAGGRSVGLLDVDLCGPSAPRMLGLVGATVHAAGSGWSPVWLEGGLGVMSIGFMLPGADDAVIWRGPRKNGLIRQFLADVDWGDLDYLVVDTPPGTSDEHISVVQLLAGLRERTAAVVVTTPQEVAMADVRKELSFCRKVGLRVLGVVENMAGFVCPCCATRTDIFPAPRAANGAAAAADGGGPAGMAARAGVPYLGAIPIDPRLLAACEDGRSFLTAHPDAPAAAPLLAIVRAVVRAVEGDAATLDVAADDGGAAAAGGGE